MWMNPPGAAKALTPSVSSTMNRNGRLGPGARLRGAHQAHVPVDGLVLHDAVPDADLLADSLAEPSLVLVGDLELRSCSARLRMS